MGFWETFWPIALLVSATGFAAITLVVTVRGARDMKNMLSGLQARHTENKTH
jgi:hypothetical protein